MVPFFTKKESLFQFSMNFSYFFQNNSFREHPQTNASKLNYTIKIISIVSISGNNINQNQDVNPSNQNQQLKGKYGKVSKNGATKLCGKHPFKSLK